MKCFQRIFFQCFLLTVSFLCHSQLPGHKSNSDSSFVKFEKQLYSINPENGDQIPVYFVQLDDLQQAILDFSESLKNQAGDTINSFYTRWIKAKHYLDSIKPLITGKMGRIDLVLYDEALKYANKGDTAYASQLFIQSLRHNPLYAPAAYELVHIHLKPGSAHLAAFYLDQYSGSVDSALNPYYFGLLKTLAEQVLDNMIAWSNIQIHLDLPLDALEFLEEAISFNDKHPSPLGKEKLQQVVKLAHQGMYSSLLRIGDKALTYKKWDLAEHYYTQAKLYRQENSKYLEDDKAWQKGLEKITAEAERTFLLASQPKPVKYKKHHGRHREHRYSKVKPKKPARIIPAEAAPDTLVAFYLKHEDSCFVKQDYYVALRWCDSAVAANLSRKAVSDSLVRSRYRRSARIIILDSVHSAYFLAWKNDRIHAGTILNTSRQYQLKYYLAEDKEVTSAISELDRRLHESLCFSAKSAYEEANYRALSQFMRGNFLEGKDFLDNAKATYLANPTCQLTDSMRINLENKYHGLILWQGYWKEAQQALSVKNYPLFYRQYSESYNTYKSYTIENKGIRFSDLLSFIKNQKDRSLTLECISLSLKNNKLDDAWFLINLLKEDKCKPVILAGQLADCGKQMALDDRKNGNSDWLLLLKKSGRWFHLIKKSYIREIKATSGL